MARISKEYESVMISKSKPPGSFDIEIPSTKTNKSGDNSIET